jgi:hypothetical protein
VEIRVIAAQVGVFTNSVGAASAQPDPVGSNNSASEGTTVVSSLKVPTDSAAPAVFVSTLDTPSPDLMGRVILNDTLVQETRNRAPYTHHATTNDGQVRVEASADMEAADDGYWTFDFASSADFSPGSIRVESGRLVSLSDRKVVFSVSHGSEPIRFSCDFEGTRDGRR